MKNDLIGLWILGFLCLGCGASTGTGQDSTSTVSIKQVSVTEIMAVDDEISGGVIRIGKSLNQATGEIVPMDSVQNVTGSNGKVSGLQIQVLPTDKQLFFQVSGGNNGFGGPALANDSRFTGVLELNGTGDSEQISRVNITPFTTLVANTKAKNPELNISTIASAAVAPFFASTAIGQININTSDYRGVAKSTVETKGDAPVLQLMNELIKEASLNSSGTTTGDKVAAFLAGSISEIESEKNIFETTGTVFNSLKSVVTRVTTDSALSDGFFSKVMTVLSTSSEASFRPATFTSAEVKIQSFVVERNIMIDNVAAMISQVSSSTAIISASTASQIVLTSLPSIISFDLSNSDYKVKLDSTLKFYLAKALDNYIEAYVNPIELDSRTGFVLTFPEGALITGKRVEPTAQVLKTVPNQSKDIFPSPTGKLNLDVATLIKKGESSSGVTVPTFSGDTLNVTIEFDKNSKFVINGTSETFYKFSLTNVKIQ